MRKKFTARTIEALTPGQTRYEVRDEDLAGFFVRVSPSGLKVFGFSKRINGRARRIKIGSYPTLSLKDARLKAQAVLRDIELGTFEQRQPVRRLGDVIESHIEQYVRVRIKNQRERIALLKKFSSLYDRPLDQIERRDVVVILDRMIAEGAPTRANRALASIKRLFSWCVERGELDASPVTGMRSPTKEVSRERVLSDAELVKVWAIADAENYPFGPFLKLLALTGQRRNEVAEMRWSEIDPNYKIWTIPGKRAKNSKEHIVPLAPLATEILKSLPRFLTSDLVFTTTGRTPISGFGRFKTRIDRHTGVREWTFHDLRRTVATGMAKSKIDPHIIEAVLNHKSGVVSGVAAVYNRHSYLEEKQDAIESWNSHIKNIVTADCCRKIDNLHQSGSNRSAMTQAANPL
jgi:integrase